MKQSIIPSNSYGKIASLLINNPSKESQNVFVWKIIENVEIGTKIIPKFVRKNVAYPDIVRMRKMAL